MERNEILASLWVIFFIAGFIGFGIMHEVVHQKILEYNGIDSKIEFFKYSPDIVTEQTNLSQICDKNCMNLHSLNEIISYPLEILLMIAGIGIFLILLKENK